MQQPRFRLIGVLSLLFFLVPVQGQEVSSRLVDRFAPPPGFERQALDSSSFAYYLRHLPLKPPASRVRYYDGSYKAARGVYLAVLDQEISPRDLQQCADAVMRLRGEYLYQQQRYDEIHFNFLSDGKPRYYRDRADAAHSYRSFRRYMDYIFAYANTASLHDELVPVDFEDLQIGDVLIVKGRPYGHAVTVVDLAIHPLTNEKAFILAQSYMPAQETQILLNPADPSGSPWYRSHADGPLRTPEWTFQKSDLRRWK
jgi:hypothetical protein